MLDTQTKQVLGLNGEAVAREKAVKGALEGFEAEVRGLREEITKHKEEAGKVKDRVAVLEENFKHEVGGINWEWAKLEGFEAWRKKGKEQDKEEKKE